MWGNENWGEMVWGFAAAVPLLSPMGLVLLALLLVGTATLVLHRRESGLMAALFVVFLVVPLSAYAGSVVLPNVFSNGTIADADEVNANFNAVATAVNDNDAQIGGLSALFGTNTSLAASGSGATCTLGEVWLTAGAVAALRTEATGSPPSRFQTSETPHRAGSPT